MKKHLIFLFLFLLTLMGFAQQPVDIRHPATGVFLYKAIAPTPNRGLYPQTNAGRTAYTTAANAGQFSLTTVVGGCVIPAGTRPPLTLPSCVSNVSWISGLRYSHNGTVLTIQGNGQIGAMKFAYLNGMPFTTTNPDSVLLTNDVFYSYGPLFNAAPYDRQWQIKLGTLPIRLTARNSADLTQTASYTISPQAGQTNIQITGGTSTTTTSTTTTSTTTTQTTATIAVNIKQEAENVSGAGSTGPNDGAGQVAYIGYPSDNRTFTLSSIPSAGNYDLQLRYGTLGDAPPTLTLLVNGASRPLSLANPGGGSWLTSTKTSIALTAGSNALRLEGAGSGSIALDYILVTGTGTSSVTTTQPPSYTATGGYQRVEIVGNSITRHPTIQAWNDYHGGAVYGPWGMDASTADKDYFSLLKAKIQQAYPGAEVRRLGDTPGGNHDDGSGWESAYWANDAGRNSRFDLSAAWQPDLIIMRLAENVTDLTHDFPTNYKALIDRLKAQNPNAKVVLTTSTWESISSTQVQVSAAIESVANERGYPVANLRNVAHATDGYGNHPTDLAHAEYANRIFAAIPAVTTTTPPSYSTNAAGFLAYTDQPAAMGDRYRFIENDSIKVGFELKVGLTIGYIALKHGPRAGQNLVNVYQAPLKVYGQPSSQIPVTVSDLGRSGQLGSDYWRWRNGALASGNQYRIGSKNTKTDPSGTGDALQENNFTQYPDAGYRNITLFDTGPNTVQGGSMWPYLDSSPVLKSALVSTQDRGTVLCGQVRPMIWGMRNELGPIVLDIEANLVGNHPIIKYQTSHTVLPEILTNPLAPPSYEAREQENPCVYTIAPMANHYTVLGSPYANGSLSTLNVTDGNFSKTYYTSESWVGGFDGSDDNAVGMAIQSPENAAYKIGHFGSNFGDWTSSDTDYLNASLQMNYENPGQYIDRGYIVAGTRGKIREKIKNTLPRPDQSFNFDFSQDNHRWWNTNGTGIKRSGYFEYNVGQTNQDGGHFMQISSPVRAWDASGLNQVQFDMAVSGGVTRLWFVYQGPGEADRDDAYQTSHRFAIDVIPDGTRRTYTVPTAGKPNWSGIINLVGLKAIRNGYGEPETPVGSTIKMYRIGKNLN